MIKKIGVVGSMIAFALAVNVSQAAAQTAAQFVGKWTITFDAPAAPPAGAPAGGAAPAGGGGGFGGRGGGGPQVLEVTNTGGRLAATLTAGGRGGGAGAAPGAAPAAPPAGAPPAGGGGGRGGAPVAISDATVAGGALVLKYTAMGRGGETPTTLTLTPDGANMKVSAVTAQGTRTGTAVKTP